MLTYKKYILRSIFPSLIAIAFILVSLVWVTQILKLLYLIDKGIKITDFLGIIILIAPSLLFMVMPVITVLAVIYVYIRLKEQKQLLILRASGLSDLSLARPALLLAFLITVFACYVSAYLMPLSYSSLKRDLANLKDNYLSNVIDVRTFNQLSKTTTIYVHNRDNNGSLSGIVLFDNRDPESRSVIFANSGSVTMKNGLPLFELKKGLRQAYDHYGNFTKLYFENLTVEISGENQNENEERIRDNMELYIQEMIWPDSSLPAEKQIRLIAQGHGRIIWPIYNYALTFLALGMFLKQPYNRNSGARELVKIALPLVLVTYFHFTLQKLSYNNLSFIFLCYANLFVCIIFSIWRTRRLIL